MIAINKTRLGNVFFVSGAASLNKGGFITAEQLQIVKANYPTLNTQSNLLVRIGFFILGTLLYASFVGAISLFAMPIIEHSYKIIVFLYAAVGLAGAEFFVKKDYYGYGFDDAFITGFQIMIAVAVGVTTESVLAGFITLSIAGAFCCLRYVNIVAALLTLIGITGIFCSLILEYGIIPKLYLSFVLFFLAIGMYVAYSKLVALKQSYFYQTALRVMQIFSLTLGYLSVNYLVVRELSSKLMGIVVTPGGDIPLAFIFYGLTFIIPLAYVVFALKTKSRNLLIVGLLAFAFSIFSIKYYYNFMPIEVALILGGIILFAFSYFCIIRLKNKESGITFMRDRNTDANSMLYAQAIIINSQINVGVSTPESEMPFGGGGFSGGGAGDSF